MQRNLRIIVVEDSEDDTILEIRQIEQAGYKVEYTRVETREELDAALKEGKWDVILSDFTMPHFTGIEALRIVRAKDTFIPFIFVSGTIGEERAVDAVKEGASDYVMKVDPKRLVPSIERELRERKLRLERETAQKELRASEEKYRDLFNGAPVGYHEIDKQGLITQVNRMELTMLGYDLSDVLGKPAWEFVADPEASRDRTRSKLAGSVPLAQSTERVYVRKNGTTFHAVTDESLIKNKERIVTGIRTVVQDITERKKAEDALRYERNLIRTLIDNVPDYIYVKDNDGRFVVANTAVVRQLGFSSESEIIGKSDYDFFPRELADRYRAEEKAIMGDGKGLFNHEGPTVDAAKEPPNRWISTMKLPLRNAQNEITGFVGVGRDITEQKELEAQHRRSQRMETLGTLAGGIAHDLNNVLTPMGLALDFFRNKYSSDEKTAQVVSTLESSMNRGTSVVKQILEFARGIETSREPMDPRSILKEMERIVNETFPKSISVSVKVEQGTRLIVADKTQIHQMVLNLCVNARDAMPNGGKLSLAAKNATIDENYSRMSHEAKPGDYVMLQVTDTGAGIRKENLEKLFEPFFTTKEAEKGTGLGLAIVHEIVESHGGFVEVQSEINKGSTFTVYLPSVVLQETAAAPVCETKPRLGQGEVVIVADDEASIREITKSALEAYGYEVLTACDGSEAVALYAQHCNEVALVMTDLAMPIMDGRATVYALRKLNPKVRIVIVTGLVTLAEDDQLLSVISGVLNKPYTATALINVITKAICEPE